MYLFYHFQQNKNQNLYNGFFSLLDEVAWQLEDHNNNIEINFRFFTFFQFFKEILCAQKIITIGAELGGAAGARAPPVLNNIV